MTSTTDEEEWDWELSPRADDQFSRLESEYQRRIASKFDEVTSSEWREPEEFLESVTNSPFQKLRVGSYL